MNVLGVFWRCVGGDWGMFGDVLEVFGGCFRNVYPAHQPDRKSWLVCRIGDPAHDSRAV